MSSRERLDAVRRRARLRQGCDRPDTPEEIAEQAALTAAMWPLQLEAMASQDASRDDSTESHFGQERSKR